MFRHARRQIEAVPFVASTVQTIDIPRDYLLKRLTLHLRGEIVVAVDDMASISQYHPAELIQRIEVIADGRETLKSYGGWNNMLLYKNRYGVFPYRLQAGVAQGTQPFRQDYCIDFGLPLSVVPADTYLNTRAFSTLQLRITWGNVDAICTEGESSGTTVLQNVNLLVTSEETTEPNIDRFGINKEFEISRIVPATMPNFEIPIPVGNVYSDFMINTHSNALKVDALISHLDLYSSGNVYHLKYLDWLADKSRAESDQKSINFDGYGLYIEMKEDGLISSALNVGDVADCRFSFDVTATGDTDIIYINCCELVLPPLA